MGQQPVCNRTRHCLEYGAARRRLQRPSSPEIPDSEEGTKSEEPRQASVPELLVTKAKQTGSTVTSRTGLYLNRSVESVRSCGGAIKSAIGLLIEKHVQDH